MCFEAVAMNIRRRMANLGLEPWQLSTLANVPPRALDKYLNAERLPTICALYKISFILGCSMEELMESVYEDGRF